MVWCCWAVLGFSLGGGIGTVEDFDAHPVGPYDYGYVESWRWSEERREQARKASRLEIVSAAPEPGGLLRVLVRDARILAEEPLPFARLAPHFPPEADVLRIRLKVVAGRMRLYAGGPTAYYGNSDVFTAIQTLTTTGRPQSQTAEPQWQTVEFDLNHPLWRNFRRAGVSTDAPRNYYNRWAQEPLRLYLAPGSQGELLIDRIDIFSRGEGRPFPKFAPEAIRRVRTIADFDDGRFDGVFQWYMADRETEWFDESWLRTKPLRFTPAKLSTADAAGRTKALVCTGPTAEEVHGTGVRTRGAADANALQFTVAAEAPGETNTLVGTGPIVPIDFFVFVAAPQPAWDWRALEPAQALRAGPGFDYQLSYCALRGRTDLHFAIYQTRRFVTPQTWTTLTLPAADFTCIYGHGVDRRRFTEHEPLKLDDVIAVGWLNPWCRSGKRSPAATTRIDEISFVQVPGTPAEHRSYRQILPTDEIRLLEQPSGLGTGTNAIRRMLMPGDVDGLEPPAR